MRHTLQDLGVKLALTEESKYFIYMNATEKIKT